MEASAKLWILALAAVCAIVLLVIVLLHMDVVNAASIPPRHENRRERSVNCLSRDACPHQDREDAFGNDEATGTTTFDGSDDPTKHDTSHDYPRAHGNHDASDARAPVHGDCLKTGVYKTPLLPLALDVARNNTCRLSASASSALWHSSTCWPLREKTNVVSMRVVLTIYGTTNQTEAVPVMVGLYVDPSQTIERVKTSSTDVGRGPAACTDRPPSHQVTIVRVCIQTSP